MGQASLWTVSRAASGEEQRVLFDFTNLDRGLVDARHVETIQTSRRRTEQLRAVIPFERAVVARADIERFAYVPNRVGDFRRDAAGIGDEINIAPLVRAFETDRLESLGGI